MELKEVDRGGLEHFHLLELPYNFESVESHEKRLRLYNFGQMM
jgi:hypothetical protein